MKVEYIFYTLGIIFIFSTVAYFSYEFLFNLANSIKTVLLILLIIIFFFVGDFLRERGI